MNAWEGFQLPPEEEEDEEILFSVAKDVLASFGIPLNDGSNEGGTLDNIDIKRGDAFSTLKASLLEEFVKEDKNLIEIRINPDGEAEFYEVGTESSNINPYYSIFAANFIKDPDKVSVMVTGAKPKQERKIYEWHQLIGPDATNYTIHDTTKLSTACLASSYSSTVTITYDDPLRKNPKNNWNDGIESIFEPGPFERFIGFSWRITPPVELTSAYTKIYMQPQSSIPVILSDFNYKIGDTENFPNLGVPKKRQLYSYQDPNDANCNAFGEGQEELYCSSDSIPLPLALTEGLFVQDMRGTLISRFGGIQGLFVVGIPLIACYGIPKENMEKQANNATNTDLFIGARNNYKTVVKLNEGIHYVILYKEDMTPTNAEDEQAQDVLPCFQFVDNLSYDDHATTGTGVDFFIGARSTELLEVFEDNPNARGSVIPLENRSGILVEQIWVQVNLDTPCFIVNDPAGKAKNIAEELKVEILGLVLTDNPPPIAMNGELINQTEGIIDNDPTETQDLEDTAMEEAYKQMSSGRTLNLNFSSLDEDETVRLSEKLYNLLVEDTGKVYTHTCGPTEQPVLGTTGPNGDIINSIEYSYTDQGSYLINVTEGSKYFGDFAGINGGIYFKQTEDITTKGTIIQDLGNHIDYKVRVDGIGDIKCINGCSAILNIRDRVSITIHNNAVES